MTRKKVPLRFIGNESARRITFKKRRHGLMKKVRELAILCGVKASAIVFGSGETQPEVWPEVAEAKNIFRQFKDMPQVEQCRRMMNQERFIKQSVSKQHLQLQRLRQENQNLEMPYLMIHELGGTSIYNLGFDKLLALAKFVEEQIDAVKGKMEKMLVQPTPYDQMFYGSSWSFAGTEGLEDIVRPYMNVHSTLAMDPNLFHSNQ